MNTTSGVVVNVKVASLRKGGQYQNISQWLADPDNVYIGRASRINVAGTYVGIKASPWANRFTVKQYGREEALRLYREDLEARLARDPALRERLLSLRGKQLGCWCSPEPCHGDTLVALISKFAPA